MNILLVHQNFPGQFTHLARRLVADGHRVLALAQHEHAVPAGIDRRIYTQEPAGVGLHPMVCDLDDAVRAGLAVAQECEALQKAGFVADLVIGHTGWGEILYIKDIWPDARVLGYFEFFYRATQSDMDFDAEFPPPDDAAQRLRTRNGVGLMGLDAVDAGITPTQWQARQYPERHRGLISVIHEGIDTAAVRPDPNASIWLADGRALQAGDEIVTFSARNMEPYRGFHVFMRALPEILRRRPKAHCLIVGGDDVSYGRKPDSGASWRETMLAEIGHRLDNRRVHFLGTLPYAQYLSVLQISAVHVYLTYPFVLSWSLLEAMSAGCQVVASRTPPVEEVITDGQNGYLVDFFDTRALAAMVCRGLRGGGDSADMRRQARDTVVTSYDLQTICLPAQMALLHRMMGVPARSAGKAEPPMPSRTGVPAAESEPVLRSVEGDMAA